MDEQTNDLDFPPISFAEMFGESFDDGVTAATAALQGLVFKGVPIKFLSFAFDQPPPDVLRHSPPKALPAIEAPKETAKPALAGFDVTARGDGRLGRWA